MGKRYPEKKPGVRTLAKATGLSVATISRVLNKSQSVTGETRDRVLKAMQEIGYTPNASARALATKRTRTIGAVVPTLAHSIFARFLNAVEQELALNGYGLVIATTGHDLQVEEQRARELLDLGAEGLIFSGADHTDGLFKWLKTTGIPAVCTSVSQGRAGLPAIGYNNTNIGLTSVRYLLSLGHRHISVIHGPKDTNDRTRMRLAGVQSAGIGKDAKIEFFETSLDVEGGSRAAQDILKTRAQPSAIFCLSDILALGVLFEAGRQNIAIPEQLSLMGCDDLDWSAHSAPPLTTLKLPTARMGQEAARSLVDFLEHARTIKTIELGASVLERQSTAHFRKK
ncbi:MAG: LacI family DNA-binding transcriptional regulator [Stappiaceae bacterium]